MNKPSAFLTLLDDFINHYLPFAVGSSSNTTISYKYAFRLLIEFMYSRKNIDADKITFKDLDFPTLVDFFNWIESKRGCSVATKNQRLSALLSFSKYAQNRDIFAASVFRSSLLKVPIKKGEGKPRAIFSLEEVAIFLRLPNERTKIGLRDKVLLSLMYASGARAQEICNITVADVDFRSNSNTKLKLIGKGGKARRIALPKSCSDILFKFITNRRIANNLGQYVFSSQTHDQMSVSCIEGIFKKYISIAKKEHPNLFRENSYPPHSMRHSTASHMLEAGVPLVVIKNFLGHKSLQSTQIYAELSENTVDKHLKEWSSKWFPNSNIMSKTTDNKKERLPNFLSIK